MPPLILTIHFDPVSQARFDEYRGRYFPPERNIVPAHLTLFHQLEQTERTFLTLDTVAKEQVASSVAVTGLRSLGRGVAFALESKPLERLHARLVDAFRSQLIPQDRQPFRPHVVIQNKTTAEIARATLTEIARDFVPFPAEALGLDVWVYLDGPWRLEKTFLFSRGDAA